MKKTLLVSSVLLLLNGCLGDSDNTITQDGYAADGYLRHANVCLDSDGDRACTGESTLTTTGDEGKFEITASQSDFDDYPVVVEAIAGITIDEDNPNSPISEGYSFYSPAGLEDIFGRIVVNPFTTLLAVQESLLNNTGDNTGNVTSASLDTVVTRQSARVTRALVSGALITTALTGPGSTVGLTGAIGGTTIVGPGSVAGAIAGAAGVGAGAGGIAAGTTGGLVVGGTVAATVIVVGGATAAGNTGSPTVCSATNPAPCATVTYTKNSKSDDPAVRDPAQRTQTIAQTLTTVIADTQNQVKNDLDAGTPEGKKAVDIALLSSTSKVVEDVDQAIQNNNGDVSRVNTRTIADSNKVIPDEGVNSLIAAIQIDASTVTVADLTANQPLYALTLSGAEVTEETFANSGIVTDDIATVSQLDLVSKPIASTLQQFAENNDRKWQDIFGACATFSVDATGFVITSTDAKTKAITNTLYLTKIVKDQVIAAIDLQLLSNKISTISGSKPVQCNYPTESTDNSGTDGGTSTPPTDTDGDGVNDKDDAFPNDANETADSDSDGVGDNADAFPNDANETVDSDSDGVGDNGDAFPNDANETVDSDSDGVGDNADAFPNDANETADSDSDGVGDNGDAFPNDANETADSDSDGVGDNSDPAPNDPFIPGSGGGIQDSDGDGIPDSEDPDPFDPNVPGLGGGEPDTDGDGVPDSQDLDPFDPNIF